MQMNAHAAGRDYQQEKVHANIRFPFILLNRNEPISNIQ